MSAIRLRFLVPAVAGTLLLTCLCIVTALFLFRQQSAMTKILRENVTSRRAAVDLEECLYDLSALLRNQVDEVGVLHDRLAQHLNRLRQVADQPEEKDASLLLDRGLSEYLRAWTQIPPRDHPEHAAAMLKTADLLEKQLIHPCQQFRLYNGRRIEQSTIQHESVLGRLAWGMTSIGALGGIAGLVLGFGVTRALGQSIRKLQVHIRDAAGKLGPELPEVILTEVAQFSEVHAQLDQLTSGIERVLSSLRQRELEVLRADQMAAVGQLAASVAHEIRNPLTSIKMLVQSAMEPPDGMPLSPEDLHVIEREIRRIEASLKTFLDFTRPPRMERRSIRLKNVLQDVLGLVRGRADKQNVRTELDIQDPDIMVDADPEQLRQVVLNLVLNSLDAQPRGGEIVISVRVRDGRLDLTVRDAGTGIEPDMMPRLFQPFASNKETGLGLGLVISRRIIEDHGGSITAENLSTRGTLIRVSLPSGNVSADESAHPVSSTAVVRKPSDCAQ